MSATATSVTHSLAKPFLAAIGVVSVALLAVRAAVGPFRLVGLHTLVNSPFGAESAFWFAFLALLWLHRDSGAAARPKPGEATFPTPFLVAALGIVALAFAHNLADPFLSDDYIIVSGPHFHWDSFLAALHRPGGDGSFRPLGTVYYQLVIALAGNEPLLWHLIGLALHLLNCGLVFAIAWQLWRDSTAAAISGLVFGLNGTRPEAALWSAGNCDLLACACVLGSIGLALANRTGRKPERTAIAVLLVFTGVLFKESAYALPLVAVWILWPYGRNYLIGASVACAALFAWRWRLFKGPGGYIDPATRQPAVLSLHPLTAAKAVLVRTWDVLLTPVNWDAPLSWWLPVAVAAGTLGLLWLAAQSGSDGNRRRRFCLIAATCCAVLPAIHLALIGQSGLGSRILYLPGAPFAWLAGSLSLNAGKRGKIAAVVMLLGMAGILEHNLSAWHRTALQAQSRCRNAHPGDVSAPGTANGVFLFQNGFAECVAAARSAQ